jgi:hypothetical protein
MSLHSISIRALLLSRISSSTTTTTTITSPTTWLFFQHTGVCILIRPFPHYKQQRHINMSTAARQRPAYLDGLFSPQAVDHRPRTPSLSRSLYSSTESINAMSNLDTQQNFNHTRPLTPACEEEPEEGNSSGDDSKSVLSLSLARSLKIRLRLRNFSLHRRSDPTSGGSSSSKISPKAATFFHGKRHSNPTHAPNKPLPALPTQDTQSAAQTQELTCYRCYYFAARNCKGWTMGGSSNDACETCLVSFNFSTSLLQHR